MRREHPFNATTNRPACSGPVGTASVKTTNGDVCTVLGPGGAALEVPQPGGSDRIADAAKNSADVTISSVFVCSADRTRTGWTVGGGVEWMLAPADWSAFLEGNYVELGSTNHNLVTPVDLYLVGCAFSTKATATPVLVGMNYRFNWGNDVLRALPNQNRRARAQLGVFLLERDGIFEDRCEAVFLLFREKPIRGGCPTFGR